MAVIARSARLLELVDADARLELLADGFHFTEGPVWHPDGYLLFSDLAGDAIWRWDAAGGARVWRRPSEMANGLTRDPQGRLLACEAASSRLTRTEADGSLAVVASHYEGRELNSPNDVVCRSDGSIYFTDPPSGRTLPHGRPRATPRELDFQGIFLVRPDGELRLLADDFVVPNGLCFSPDESLLYVNDSLRLQIRVFDVLADGSLANGRLFFQQPGEWPDGAVLTEELIRTGTIAVGLPDGMKVDELGNVYCGGPGGIWVIDPAGEQLGVIEAPQFVANLAWGEADRRTLFVCATTGLYRLRTKVAGNRPVFA